MVVVVCVVGGGQGGGQVWWWWYVWWRGASCMWWWCVWLGGGQVQVRMVVESVVGGEAKCVHCGEGSHRRGVWRVITVQCIIY